MLISRRSLLAAPAVFLPKKSKAWQSFTSFNPTAIFDLIYDTDGGSTDKGDLSGAAYVLYLHLNGLVNLRGICVTCGDDFTAPASRAILDYYGLTSIPVGAYQGSDITAGGTVGTPARTIRDDFRPTDVRSNYPDPTTFYNSVLTGLSNNNLLVVSGGFANSMAQFVNSSGANATLWNSKLRTLGMTDGQWPNSGSFSSPPGNFLRSGEWNLGGSAMGGSAGPIEAQAAVDMIAKTTKQIYWHGVEICGGTGDDPPLALFIDSDLPNTWTNANPLKDGWGTGARGAWDPLGVFAVYHYATAGVANGYYTVTQIGTPTIDTSNTFAGQDASVAGSSNNAYFVPDTSMRTIAQFRTLITATLNAQVPPP